MVTEFVPAGELSRHVESVWMTAPGEGILHIPDGTFSLVYSPITYDIHSRGYTCNHQGFFALPIRRAPTTLICPDRVLGIRLKAFTVSRAPDPIDALRWLRFPPAKQQAVNLQMLHCSDPGKALENITCLIESFVLETFWVNERLRQAVNYTLENQGVMSVSHMEQVLSMSRQALHKSFRRYMDISVKELANMWRLNTFLLKASSNESLTGAALDAGFYDQAHCTRFFRERYLISPREFLQRHQALLPYITTCIERRYNAGYDPRPTG